MSVSVSVTFVVFTDCESCTKPISTNPESMEACEYGLTRGTFIVERASRGGRGRRAGVHFVVCCRFGEDYFLIFSSSNAQPAASVRAPCLFYLSIGNKYMFKQPKGVSVFPGT